MTSRSILKLLNVYDVIFKTKLTEKFMMKYDLISECYITYFHTGIFVATGVKIIGSMHLNL